MVIERKAFGARMRSLREEKAISQSEIAEYLDVTPSCVANWEMGTRIPDVNVLGDLSEYFNVSVDYLCCRTNMKNYMQKEKKERYKPGDVLDLSVLTDDDKERIIRYYRYLTKEI